MDHHGLPGLGVLTRAPARMQDARCKIPRLGIAQVIFIVIVTVIVPILNLDAGSWILDARSPTRSGRGC